MEYNVVETIKTETIEHVETAKQLAAERAMFD